jgi:hypothetical protein
LAPSALGGLRCLEQAADRALVVAVVLCRDADEADVEALRT